MDERPPPPVESASVAPSEGDVEMDTLQETFPFGFNGDRRILICGSAFIGMLFLLLFLNLDIFLYQLNGADKSSTKAIYPENAFPSSSSIHGNMLKQNVTASSQYYNIVRSSNYELTFNIRYEVFRTHKNVESTNRSPSFDRISENDEDLPAALLSGKGTAALLVQHTPLQKLSLSVLDIKLNSPYSESSQEILLNGVTLSDSRQISLFGHAHYSSLSALDEISAFSRSEAEISPPLSQNHRCTFNGIFSYSFDPRRGKSFRITDGKYFQSYQKLLETSAAPSHRNLQMGTSFKPQQGSKDFLGEKSISYNHGDDDISSEIFSNDCSLLLRFIGKEIDLQALMNEVASFSFVYNIKTIIEIRLLWQQIRFSTAANSYIRISVISILFGAILDLIESSFLVYVGILWQTTLSYFAIMAVLKFLLFILEMRYAYTVLEAYSTTTNLDSFHTHPSYHAIRIFYLTLPFCVFFAYIAFRFMHSLLLIFYIFWIPQIISDIWFGHRNSLDPLYVSILSLLRVVLPLYMFGLASSIFSTENLLYFESLPDVTIAIAIGTIVAMQCLFSFVQRKFGPRYLIPLKFLPHVYNFYRPFPAILYEEGLQECVICINKVDLSDTYGKVCITPCDHLFHAKCLQQWMDVKMECPTCRRVLPAFG